MSLQSPNDYANYWFYQIGVNVIPANSKNKVPLVQWREDPRGNWQEVPIPLEIFEEWKSQNKFKDGIAVICGKVFRGENKDKWLNGIDCDNKLGLDKMCPSGINNIASITVVEQHANKEKCHIYFYTKEPIKSKVANDGKEGTAPQIEIKSGGKEILYCAGSIHKDGSPIEIIGIDRIKTIDKESLEIQIEDICREYNIPYLNGIPENLKPVRELIKEDFILHEGENRSIAILRYLDSKKINNPEFDEMVLFNLGKKFNQDHCKPQYDESKIRALTKQALEFGTKKIEEREIENNEPEEINQGPEIFTNKQWPEVAKEIQNKYHFVTIRETKDMWIYSEKDGVYIPDADTYIEEEAQKIIFKCTTKSVNEIKNQIKRNRTMILSSDFFDSVIINTESGVIDPNTFEVLPHSPKYLTTTKLPFAVNMKANNFKLWNHITQNIIEPKDSKLFLEILWVLISWNNPHKKCIIFKGLSDTQKTTLMEIISWIIGSKNLATVKPQKFLVSGDRFSMSRFIGKRANFSEEINNLTPDMLENLKAMIGGMVQDTELKNSNDGREFDPKRFLFIFSTNFLDSIYQRIDDNSTINRFQFMMFKHVIKKKKGDWAKEFFTDEDDKRTSIETIIRLMLSWKKGGHVIQWDEAWRTKEILRTEQPIEDKYFESGRIIEKRGERLLLDDVKADFESFCGAPIENQALGYLMKNKGFESKHGGLFTYYQGYALSKVTKTTTS